jgi:hypothetical protein
MLKTDNIFQNLLFFFKLEFLWKNKFIRYLKVMILLISNISGKF